MSAARPTYRLPIPPRVPTLAQLRRRRRAFAAVGVVLLGVLTNIGVTGYCVYSGYASESKGVSGRVMRDGQAFITELNSSLCKSICVWVKDAGSSYSTSSTIIDGLEPPPWARLSDATAKTLLEDPYCQRSHWAIAYGWPMRAFQGGATRIPGAPRLVNPEYWPELAQKRTISEGRRTRSVPPEPRSTPLEPLWPGVLVNSAFYAAGWGVFLWWSGRRERRGR